MAKFVYRLKKVFELRERRVKEQEQKVIDAKKVVAEIQAKIDDKKKEAVLVRQNMATTPHTLLEAHHVYIQKCNKDVRLLEMDKNEANAKVKVETDELKKRQAELEALEKHKEKAKEEWLEEQKAIEMKKLDEVASQRYFRNQQIAAEEEAAEYEH